MQALASSIFREGNSKEPSKMLRRYWEEHFKAEVSFNAFCDELLGVEP